MSKPEVKTQAQLAEIEGLWKSDRIEADDGYMHENPIPALCATIRELWEAEALTKELEKAKLPCGHSDRYGYTEDGGAYIACLACECGIPTPP